MHRQTLIISDRKDCYPCRVQNLSEWAAAANFGDAAKTAEMPLETTAYHTIRKLLSVDGRNMRYYHPCWRG